MKKTILAILITGLLTLGGFTIAQIGGGIMPTEYWFSDGVGLFPADSAWNLGSATTRIAKGWFTDLDASGVFTLGGTVGTGGIDMANNLITNIGHANTDFTTGGGLNLAGTFNASGTSNLSTTTITHLTASGGNLVPYTGATADVDLGLNDIIVSNIVDPTTSFIALDVEARTFTNISNATVLDFSGDNVKILGLGSGFGAILSNSLLTTTDKTFTFPNMSGTFALLENPQTFTGTKTFNNATYSALFTGGNVGIGTTGPGQKLEIDGGMRLNTTTARPTCSATTRGTFWFIQGGTGVKDSVAVCAKDAADIYDWRVIY